MYVLGCDTSTIFHLRLEAPNGVVDHTSAYTTNSSVDGSTSGGVFTVDAIESVVLVGRPDSDEVGIFHVFCLRIEEGRGV